MYQYPDGYFARFRGGATRSAEIVLPIVKAGMEVSIVVGFGCGTGAWLSVWQRLGVQNIVGCDGPYVDPGSLMFDSSSFVPVDLSKQLSLGRRFDLAQSLEVAEHLPPEAAASFVDTLVSHAPVILFSAASPGQGGEHHVNEQPLEYWGALFRRHGFQPIDAVRPRLVGEKRVERWYRYNSMLFVDQSRVASLGPQFRSAAVPEGTTVRDHAPPAIRIRNRRQAHAGTDGHAPSRGHPAVWHLTAGRRRGNRAAL
jgi:hypothetical protein